MPLFRMVRKADAEEPRIAARAVLPATHGLRERIYAILLSEGGKTDRELETRPEFQHFAPSSVRKRRSELFSVSRVARDGRRDKMAIWRAIPDGP